MDNIVPCNIDSLSNELLHRLFNDAVTTEQVIWSDLRHFYGPKCLYGSIKDAASSLACVEWDGAIIGEN
jgi:hypothetical protein